MAKFLIDTHVFLWFSEGSKELSQIARELIEDKGNHIYLSIASLWEISIKSATGKLNIARGYNTVIDDVVGNDIEILPINFAHTLVQNKFPFHHRDPFDRIIAAQAIVEGLPLISRDEIFVNYFAASSHQRVW